jgi:hypothetical protein
MIRLLFVFLGILTLLRLAYIGQMELAPDEAYYFMWSERPDISYYSKGPGVAAVIQAGTWLFGANEFGVRFFSPIFSLATSILTFLLARRIYDGRIGFWAVMLLNATPIFNVGSLVMTIDPISIFFWTAALLTFWLSLEKTPGFSLWWPVTGLMIGLGFLAKYTNAVELISIGLTLGLSKKNRVQFLRPGFYLMLLAFAICTLPPIIWNARHEWITVAHLSARGGLDSAFSLHPTEFLEFLGAHFGVYSPLIFGGMLFALVAGCRRFRIQSKPRFLLCFGLPLLILYFTLALKEAGEANWTAPAFVSIGILTVALWMERAEAHAWMKPFAVAGIALGMVMSLIVINFDAIRAMGFPLPYSADPSARMRGWRSTADTVVQLRKDLESDLGESVFLIADSYQTAAALNFYMPEAPVEGPGHPRVYIPESQNIENQFSFWPRYDEFVERKPGTEPKDVYYTEEAGSNPFMGRTAIYITTQGRENPPTPIRNGFRDTEILSLFELKRRGLPLRQIRLFICHDYQTLPL